MNFTELGCCGIKELNGISASSPPVVLDAACSLWNGVRNSRKRRRAGSSFDGSAEEGVPSQAIILFSSADSASHPPTTYGDTFATYLREQKLGRVEEIVPLIKGVVNPNTTRRLRVWHWYVDMGAFRRWRANYIQEEAAKFLKAQTATISSTAIHSSSPPS